MVRTRHTRATGDQEATRDLGATLAPATTRAMDLLRGPQEATLATLARLTPAPGLLQVVPHPPSTPCCKTGARGFQAAMKEGRPRDQADPPGALAEATLAGDTRLTRTTEDRARPGLPQATEATMAATPRPLTAPPATPLVTEARPRDPRDLDILLRDHQALSIHHQKWTRQTGSPAARMADQRAQSQQ